MSKISGKKIPRCASEHSMFANKVLSEKTFFVNFLFYTGHKTCHFLRNFVCKHIMSRCSPGFFFRIFINFQIGFLGNGCIYTYEPKWIFGAICAWVLFVSQSGFSGLFVHGSTPMHKLRDYPRVHFEHS